MTAAERPAEIESERRNSASAERPDRLLLLTAAIALLTAAPLIEGKLQAIDVVSLLALPFIPSRVWRIGVVRLLVVALVAWSAGQVVSDEVNGLGVQVSMQVVTAATMLGIIPFLVFLAGRDFRRMRYLVAGISLGLALELIFVEQYSITESADWKFGLNGVVSIGLLALTDLTWRRARRFPSIVALAAICALGVATDDRHLTGIAVLTALLLLVRRRRPPRVMSVIAGVVLLLAALSGAFIQAAESGALGERTGVQIQEFGSNPVSLLVNTRPELFQEFYLFSDRPIFGWGSNPHLNSRAYLESIDLLRQIGIVREDLNGLWLDQEVPGLSAHSQAVDSWARAGVLAVPFWVILAVVALWVGTTAIRFRSSPLLVLWTMLILWDLLFSPLTGHIGLAAYLALAVCSLKPPMSDQHRE